MVALGRLGFLSHAATAHPRPGERDAAALRSLLERQPRVKNYGEVLAAASSFPSLMSGPQLGDRVLATFDDPDPEIQRAGMRIALERLVDDAQVAPSIQQAFTHFGSVQRSVLIDEMNEPKLTRRHLGVSGGAVSQDQAYFLKGKNVYLKDVNLLDQPILFGAVLASLGDRDANVRAAASDALRKRNGIEQQPEFRAALGRLKDDPNARLQLIARNVLSGKKLGEVSRTCSPAPCWTSITSWPKWSPFWPLPAPTERLA